MDEKIEQLAKDLKLIKSLQASNVYTPNYQEAKALFSLGYRKIPEDVVVLSKEEYAELNITARKYNEAIEQARKEAEDCSKKLEKWKKIAKGCAKEADRRGKIAEECYKELEKYNEESDKLRDENESLRKKLADAYELENLNAYLYQDLQNARKETAREILRIVDNKLDLYRNGVVGVTSFFEGYNRAVKEIKKIIAKQFGVEIEV